MTLFVPQRCPWLLLLVRNLGGVAARLLSVCACLFESLAVKRWRVCEQALCDFPDAPGPREGSIEKIPTTQPDMVARLRLIYYDGLPKDTTRIVEIFDNCPAGFSARFLPVQYLNMDYDTRLGLETPVYEYQPGVAIWQKGAYVRKPSGYPKVNARGIETYEGYPILYLDHTKTDEGTFTRPAISGSYSGYFQYGTTRRRSVPCSQ